MTDERRRRGQVGEPVLWGPPCSCLPMGARHYHGVAYNTSWNAQCVPTPTADPSGDGEPLHEWACPSCGATTRARMADHPGDAPDIGRLREEIARTICESDGADWGHYLTDELGLRSDYRKNADALLSGPLAPLLAALDRVRALHQDGADYDLCALCSFGLSDDCPTARAVRGDA